MKKILLSAFALFASLTMVNAQNLLTDGSIDRTSVNGEGALQTCLAFSDWGWAAVTDEAVVSGEITSWESVSIMSKTGVTEKWHSQIRIQSTVDMVAAKNYKFSFNINLKAIDGDGNVTADAPTGEYVLIIQDNAGGGAWRNEAIAYADGKFETPVFAGKDGKFDVVFELPLGSYQGTITNMVLEESDEEVPEAPSNLVDVTSTYGEVNLDPYFENEPDYTFMHDGWHQINDWLLMYAGDWGSADMQWDINVWENESNGAVAYEELTTSAATNGDIAGIQFQIIAPAELCGLTEGEWYEIEMVFAAELNGGALKNWADLNEPVNKAETYLAFSQVKQCVGDGITQNETVGQVLGVGMAYGVNGLTPAKGTKIEILGMNVYASTEGGERGELVYTTIEGGSSPVAEEAASVLVYGNEGKIIVAAEGAQVSVYTVAGAKVYEGSKSIIDMAAGVYVVVVDGVATKVIVK